MKNYGSIFVLLLLICACGATVEENQNSVAVEGKQLNYAVMIDLSDRIAKDSTQIQRDILLVKLLFQKFQHQMLDTVNFGSFQVMLPSQPQFQNQMAIFEDLLSLKLQNETLEARGLAISSFEEKLDEVLVESYQFSLNYLSKSDFKKVDIWSFFKNQLVNKLDSDAQNYLFVFTDGYLTSENTIKKGNRYQSTLFLKELRRKDWETVLIDKGFGLMPIEEQFDKLAVMVLELRPNSEFEFESEILKKTWSNWLAGMKVNDHKILGRLPLSEVQSEITAFLGEEFWDDDAKDVAILETSAEKKDSSTVWESASDEGSKGEKLDDWDSWEQVEKEPAVVQNVQVAPAMESSPIENFKSKKVTKKPLVTHSTKIKPVEIDINPGPTFTGGINESHTEYLEETFNRMISIYDSRAQKQYQANIERYFEKQSQIIQYGKSSGRKLKSNSTRLFLKEARVSLITIDSLHLGNNGKIKTLFISDK